MHRGYNCTSHCRPFRLAAKDEGLRTGLPDAEVAAAVAFREKSLKERASEEEQSSAKPVGVKVRDTLLDKAPAAEDADADDEGDDIDERTPFLRSRKQRETGLKAPPAPPETKPRTLSALVTEVSTLNSPLPMTKLT